VSPHYNDQVFADGQTVLAYTATALLYKAAGGGGRANTAAETWVNLCLVSLDNMPTGTVICQDPESDGKQRQPGHGLNVMMVARSGDGKEPKPIAVCTRLAGTVEPVNTTEWCAPD
jgi:hypothetical protein